MKPGLNIGYEVQIEAAVTPEMFAQFEGAVVHPTYSTVSMVYHMEWAARKVILPFLEDHEEGMGASVTVKHIAPAPQGSVIKVTATVSEITSNSVITKMTVESENRTIGVGEVKQAILPKSRINAMLNVVT